MHRATGMALSSKNGLCLEDSKIGIFLGEKFQMSSLDSLNCLLLDAGKLLDPALVQRTEIIQRLKSALAIVEHLDVFKDRRSSFISYLKVQ